MFIYVIVFCFLIFFPEVSCVSLGLSWTPALISLPPSAHSLYILTQLLHVFSWSTHCHSLSVLKPPSTYKHFLIFSAHTSTCYGSFPAHAPCPAVFFFWDINKSFNLPYIPDCAWFPAPMSGLHHYRKTCSHLNVVLRI